MSDKPVAPAGQDPALRPQEPAVARSLTAAVPAMALAVAALAGLVVVTGYADPTLLALLVALAGGVVAWGWAGLLGLPSPRGTATVLYLATAALVLSVVVVVDDPWLRWLPVAVAVSVITAFGHQLARRDGRPRLVESLSSTVLAIGIVTSGACLVPLARIGEGAALLAAAMAAVAGSALTDLLGRWPALRVWLAPLAMAVGGLAAAGAGAVNGLHWGPMVLLGVVVAALSVATRAVLGVLPSSAHARPRLVCAASSVLVTGVLPYVVAQIFFVAPA